MDDLQSKLAGILNDPESMDRVRQMAENLFADNEGQSDNNQSDADEILSGEQLGMLMSIISKINGQQEDDRTHLLTALKPYLSKKRQEKTENAIKILKLLELLPLLKESGFLNIL